MLAHICEEFLQKSDSADSLPDCTEFPHPELHRNIIATNTNLLFS